MNTEAFQFRTGLQGILGVTFLSLAVLLAHPSPARCIEEGQHNKQQEKCPEGMREPRNCNDIRQMAYKLARVKGYKMGSDNIPNVMQRRYIANRNDCTTGNAHIACMFNDECTEQFGKLKGLRSNSAYHATTMFVSKSGKKFECDFTPQSSGIFIRKNADTVIGDAVPDAGESMDPAYDCKLNGANFSPLGEGEGGLGGGGMNSLATLLMLMSMLQNQQQQQPPPPMSQPEPELPPEPTLTPTPTPTSSPLLAGSSLDDSSASKVTPAGDVVSGIKATAAWDAPRDGMF